MFGSKLKKERREEDHAVKGQEQLRIESMMVSTLPSCSKEYKIVGIVSSGLGNHLTDFNMFMNQLKQQAFQIEADAVIGITFQTLSSPVQYTSKLNANKYDNDHHSYSEIQSRAVGTAIKYLE